MKTAEMLQVQFLVGSEQLHSPGVVQLSTLDCLGGRGTKHLGGYEAVRDGEYYNWFVFVLT